MNMHRGRWASAIGMLLMVTSPMALAQADAPQTQTADGSDDPLLKGAYVAPLGSFVLSIGDHELSSGFGGEALLGYRRNIWAMEIGGIASVVSGHGKDAKFVGGTLNGLAFPFKNLPGLYGTVGVGGLEVRDYPTHTGPFSMTTIDGGVGNLWPLQFGNYEFAIRVEALYRYGKRDGRINAERQDIDAPHNFDDVLLNVGLQLPLGKKQPPPPPPEPAKVVAPADGDSDGDGVLDSLDQCPATPPATPVNSVGCPLPPPPPPCKAPMPGDRVSLAGCGTGDIIVLRGVNFEFAKARLTPNAQSILDQVADELVARPEIDIELSGYTDSIGTHVYNQRLSEQRAASVVRYLMVRGIAASRMTSAGYGETQPLADNASEEGREMNRRVELKITGSTEAGASADEGRHLKLEPAALATREY